MDYVEALLAFCQQHTPIYCYGAGDYGTQIYFYLKIHHISVKGFIVSNPPIRKTKCNIPIYELASYKRFPLGTGIILSLAHKHQAGILTSLKKKYSMVDVYELQDDVVGKIKIIPEVRRQKHIYELLNDVFRHNVQYKNNCVVFEALVQAFLAKYDNVYLRYIDMRQIGAISSWIYYVNERVKDPSSTFYLFYPYVWDHDRLNSQRWMGANHYLSNKLSLPGIAMISDINLAFWQVVLKKYIHMQRMLFDDQFQLIEYVHLFNITAEQYKVQVSRPSYISFMLEERKKFSLQSKKMGICGQFVCIAARNSVYRKEITQSKAATEDIIDRFRNTDIHSYRKAIRYLAGQGVQTVRMGALVDAPLKEPGLVDYAFYFRTEPLDIFLLSKCQFFVSDPSGIQFLAELFSKPLVIINASVFTTRNDTVLFLDPSRDIGIPKKLWDTRHKRFLTISDMLNIEVNSFLTNKKSNCGPQNALLNYYERDIVPIDNTPEEILDVVQEMWLRLHGDWIPEDNDQSLQLAYRKIVDQYPKGDNFLFQWRMGAKFLRKNKWILQ